MPTERKPYFTITPEIVRRDKRLSYFARTLYGDILVLSAKNGFCNASNSYFAEQYSCTIRYVSAALGQLNKYKYVKIEYPSKTQRKMYPLYDCYSGEMTTEQREGKPATPAKSYKPIKNPNVPIDAGAARLVKQMEEKMRQSMSMPITPITTEIN